MQDKYIWLEEVLSQNALDFVKKFNEESVSKLKSHQKFNQIEEAALKFFGTKDKIPYINLDDNLVYNHWTDDSNPQGLLRRTTIKDFLNVKPNWEIILDLDNLSKAENIKWVFKGYDISPKKEKMLLYLSPGGSDANVVREYDILKKEFLKIKQLKTIIL